MKLLEVYVNGGKRHIPPYKDNDTKMGIFCNHLCNDVLAQGPDCGLLIFIHGNMGQDILQTVNKKNNFLVLYFQHLVDLLQSSELRINGAGEQVLPKR